VPAACAAALVPLPIVPRDDTSPQLLRFERL
jgi:hypothetical protein